MLQYVLTGLAGIALGIVAMRVWQARDTAASAPAPGVSGDDPIVLGSSPPAVSARTLLVGAAAFVVLAAGILVFRSPDDATPAGISGPAMGTVGGTGSDGKPLDDVDTMIQRLAQRLAKDPKDGEGFRMLGWSYLMTGHADKAIPAYRQAVALLPKQANVHAGLGEALVGVAGGTITPEAKAAFDRAVSLDRTEPRARYFEALWLAQHGQLKQALDQWIALANGAPADAPWLADVQRQISETSGKLGIDVSSRLTRSTSAEPPAISPAAMEAASQLPESDRQAMIDGMVEGLADKLKSNPRDADGWIRLLRSRMALGQDQKARDDLVVARKALAGEAADLARVDAAAREFKVPGSR